MPYITVPLPDEGEAIISTDAIVAVLQAHEPDAGQVTIRVRLSVGPDIAIEATFDQFVALLSARPL